MNPYRKPRPRPEVLDSTNRAASYRAARLRLLTVAGLLVSAGVALPLAARSCKPAVPPLEVPPELLRAGATFPAPEADLRPAVPLAPLLAADAPEQLAVVEPTANAINLRPGEPLVVRFNRPMVEGARVGKPGASDVIAITPPVRGRGTWTSRNTFSFEAEARTWDATRTASFTIAEELRSLAGEEVAEFSDRTVVFDAGPRFVSARHASRLMPGEPLSLLFSGKVDAGALPGQMLVYEVDGGRRALPFGVAERPRDRRGLTPVEVQIRQALPPGAHFAVALAPPIAWGGSSPRVVHFEIAPRPRIEGFDCPDDAAEASACAHDDAPGKIVDVGEVLRVLSSEELSALPEDAVQVKPKLPAMTVKIEDKKRIAVRGDWDPGQVYEVRFEGLRDADGRPLARVPPLAVRSAGRAPEVRALSGRLAFERDAEASLAVAGIHVDTGEARVAEVPPGQEIEAALFPARFVAPARSGAYRATRLADLLPSARANRWGRGQLAWAAGEAPGSTAVISLLPDSAARAPEAIPATFAQRTDLGVDAKILPRGVLAWVTSVSGARPIAGSHVTVARADGEAIAEGATDARGVAWVPLAESPLEGGVVVRATSGADRAVVVIDPRTAMGPRHLGLAPGEAPLPEDAWIASVFTDRGICRPGETIHAKAVVRIGGIGNKALSAPPGGSVRVSLFGPTGEAPRDERVVSVSSFGSVDADFPIADGAEAGRYRVEIRRDGQDRPAGAASFTVGDYQQPTFRVDLSVPAGGVIDREPVHASLHASYLFGPPAARLPVHWSLVRDGAASYPDRLSDYVFTPVGSSGAGGTIAEGDVTLDEAGRASIDAVMALGAPLREDATLEVTVRDVSGLVTSARRSFRARPSAFEVGVRRAEAWIENGRDLDVETIVIDDNGALSPGRKVEARIVREGWHTYWEWSGRGRHDDDEDGEGEGEGAYAARRTQAREVVHRCAVTSTEAPLHCAWKPDRAGTYLLEAVTTDDRGRRSTASQRVYVAGPDEHPDRDPPGTAIAITPQKRTYEVGETAEIAFESPFPEAEALLTVERDGVIVTEERRVAAGGNVIRFPVTAAMVPNAFAAVSLARPRTGPPGKKIDLDAPDLRVGIAEIAVRPPASPLAVSVDVAGPSAPAGSDVPVSVTVRDAAGQGVVAEVALFAVDEGTLRVTGYALPDVLAGLFRRLPPAFAWEDLRRALVSRIDEPLVPSAGGDGGHTAPQRRAQQDRFDPTPLWLPRLVTDADGRASAVLRLPARPTQYRIMAAAIDEATRAGSAQRDLTAAMPLVIRPVLPAAVTAGDRFQAAAFVNNGEDTPADVTVTPIVDGVPRAPQELHLDAHGEARVAEWIEAARPEDLVIRFEAHSGGGVVHAEGRVSVAVRGHTRRSEVAGAAVGGRDLSIALPASAASGPGAVTISIAAHPFVGLDGSFEALLASPYAGAEALSSSVIALAAYAGLDGGARPGGVSPEEIAARARSAIARLTALQTTSGGFGDFTAASAPDAYLSAYALHALTAARRAGFAVPEDAVDRARSFVHGEVRDTTFGDRGEGGHDDLAFALRAIAEAGEPDADRAAALYDQRERLTPYGLAQLALSLDASDRRRDALVLDAEARVLATREDEKKRPRVLRWYDGSARTLGAVLEAALAVDVGRAEAGRLCTRILSARSEATATWWSTHETSHALAALAAYAATVRAEAPLAPRITLDGAPLAPAQQTKTLAWYTLPAARVAGAPHTIHVEGPGTLFFSLSARWTEPLGPLDEVARGEQAALHRILEDATGKRLAPDAHVKLGDLVRVRLFLFTESGSPPYLAVRDRLAGGLDPLDAAHETTPRASLWALLGMGPDDDVVDARGHWAARTLDAITYRAFSPARATFYFARSASGLREITYGARATTVGTFVIPPAEVEAMYAPGFVARSAAATLTVDP